MIIIPVHSERWNYGFDMELDGYNYDFSFRWNPGTRVWYMDLVALSFTSETYGIAVIGGLNLTEAYAIPEMGGIVLIDELELDDNPDDVLFGDRWKLLYVTREEKSAFTQG